AQHRVFSPRTDLGEPRILLDLDAPALVLGEVPVEHVELVQGEQVQVLENELLRHEVPAHVEVATAPSEERTVFDLDAGDRLGRVGDGRAAEDRGGQELQQSLDPP